MFFFIIIQNQMGDPVIHAILSKCSAIVRNFNYGGISAKYYWDINKPWLGCNGTFKHNQSAKNEPLYITQIIYISCNLPIYQYYCCVFIGMYVCMYAVACTGLRRGRGEMLLQGKWAGVDPPLLGHHGSRFYHDSLSCWVFYFASCLSITAKLISIL